MEFDRLIQKRASIRSFISKKPHIEQVMEIIESANHAPSPGNLPILKYIVIEDKEKINKITDACQQPFIKEAQILIIVCSDSKNAKKLYDERAFSYVKQHAGAAIEHMLLKITELGLVSCWIGAFADNLIKDIIKAPDEINIEAVIPVAYSYPKQRIIQRTKPSLENRIFFETWKNKFRKGFTKPARELA